MPKNKTKKTLTTVHITNKERKILAENNMTIREALEKGIHKTKKTDQLKREYLNNHAHELPYISALAKLRPKNKKDWEKRFTTSKQIEVYNQTECPIYMNYWHQLYNYSLILQLPMETLDKLAQKKLEK